MPTETKDAPRPNEHTANKVWLRSTTDMPSPTTATEPTRHAIPVMASKLAKTTTLEAAPVNPRHIPLRPREIRRLYREAKPAAPMAAPIPMQPIP